MVNRTLCVVAGLLVNAWAVWAQAAPRPAFDVASVKQGQPAEGKFSESLDAKPGSLIMRNLRFTSVVCWAYGVEEYQVSGPGWINEERYDIIARVADAAPEARMREMLQTLLSDRFKMEAHRQTKEMQALVMVVGKNGHKLREPKEGGSGKVRKTKAGAISEGGTVAELAEIATQQLRMPVVDQTGLTGHYDFTLDLAPYITPETNKNADMYGIAARAFLEELGLKVETRKMPIGMLVIDRVEKMPTEN